MMELHPVRLGTSEAEAILSDEESPLSISLVFCVGPDSLLDTSREVGITLLWQTAGKKVAECKKLLDAIDGLRRGKGLRVLDIRTGRAIFESSVRPTGRPDPISVGFRRTVLLASQIEKEFSVPLRMPVVISNEDDASLFHLDCLLNGSAYSEVKDTRLRLVKADGETGAGQEAFIRGDWSVTLTDAPSDYLGYFSLFGQRIPTRTWVRVVEFAPTVPGAYLEEFGKAPTGAEFSIEITAKGPAFLSWRKDSALKNIEIGTLAQPES